MPTVTSRTFRSGNSQAVRLPREVAFPDDTLVTIIRSGDVVTIYPARPSLREMIRRLRTLPKPNHIEKWDDEPLPERPGL